MMKLEGKSVLVVDDEKEYVESIAEDFLDLGCKIFKAYNGQEALDILKLNPEIDIIISDMRMPKMDGKELLIKLKEENPFTPIIIFITGHSDLPSQEAYHLGVDSILSKPFKMPHLIETAKRLITPLETRFSSPTNSKNEQPLLLEKGHSFQLGRGGISFCSSSGQLKPGQEICFEIQDDSGSDQKLEGQGIVRWVMNGSEFNCTTCIGIEFLYLAPESRERALQEIKEKQYRPYIPLSSCTFTKKDHA